MTAPLLNKKQLAELLGIPSGTVDKKVSRREWPFTKVGRHIRFAEEHVAAIVRQGNEPAQNGPLAVQPLRLVDAARPSTGPKPPPRPAGPPTPSKQTGAAA
jgi:excisionase family DNA binding protein